MNRYVSRGLWTVLITGGLCVLGAGVAQAAETSGDDGAASGNQAIVQVQLPIDVSGNAIAGVGDALSSGAESAPPAPDAAPAPDAGPAPDAAPAPVELSTGGDDSLLGGDQAVIDVDVPITVGGNAISVIGDSSTSDSATGGAADPASAPAGPADSTAPAAPVTSGDDSVAGGNQVPVDVEAPITIGGNAISVIGDSSTSGSSVGTSEGTGSADADQGSSAPSSPVTSGEDSVGGGNQLPVDVAAPITIGGNGIAVIGDAESRDSSVTGADGSGSATGTEGALATSGGSTTDGDDSILGGNQVTPVIGLPVTLGGNGIAVIGDAETTGSDVTTTTGGGSGPGDGAVTSGDDGILGGNQITPVVDLPVTLGGNGIAVIGDAETTGSDVTTTTGGGSGPGDGAVTSGDDGILGGNQITPVVDLPVTLGGNGIAVIGDAETTGSDVTTTTGGGSGDPVTGGDDGILGGNQIIPVIGLPVTVGGNAVCVIGDCTTGGSTVTPTDPTDPTDPTTPTDPTDPVDPTDPTDPVTPPTPGNPGTPVTPVTPALPGSGTGTSVTAGLGGSPSTAAGVVSGSGSLALTGATPGLLVGGLALLLVLGMLMLLIARRNRSAE